MVMSQAYFDSPLGLLQIVATDNGICEINFVKQRGEDSPDISACLTECKKQLAEYFSGIRRKFDLPLDLNKGTTFYREVWRLVKAIPYGRTRSYSVIAESLGRPQASRAVGQANGRNPIPIIIPCHRVIGKNGKLTGYAYGVEMKEALLAIENPRQYVHQGDLFH